MRHDKNDALKLRLQGKSYGEITRAFGVPKATLSFWLSHLELSERTRQKIQRRAQANAVEALIKRNQRQTVIAQKRSRELALQSSKELTVLDKEKLLLVGTALYWAEGYKRPKTVKGRVVTYHPVSLTNSDPALIQLFLRFLREVCGVPEEKIKISLRYFPHQNLDQLLAFWQKATELPAQNFGKSLLTTSRTSQGIRPFNQLPHGVVQIRVSDTALFYRIMGWIEGLKQFS